MMQKSQCMNPFQVRHHSALRLLNAMLSTPVTWVETLKFKKKKNARIVAPCISSIKGSVFLVNKYSAKVDRIRGLT